MAMSSGHFWRTCTAKGDIFCYESGTRLGLFLFVPTIRIDRGALMETKYKATREKCLEIFNTKESLVIYKRNYFSLMTVKNQRARTPARTAPKYGKTPAWRVVPAPVAPVAPAETVLLGLEALLDETGLVELAAPSEVKETGLGVGVAVAVGVRLTRRKSATIQKVGIKN